MYGIAQSRVAFHCNGQCRRRRLPLLIRDQAVVSFSSLLGTRSLKTSHSHGHDVSSQPIITSSRNRTPINTLPSCIEQSIKIRRNFHTTQYAYSDNLLGHSPMARSDPNKTKPAISPGSAGPSWGVDANTAGGGVWAQNSSKREKLNELLTELKENGVDTGIKGMETLDEAASAQEKLDLEFADGLKMIAKYVDNGGTSTSSSTQLVDGDLGVEAAIPAEDATKQMFQVLESASSSVEEWEKPKFEATMNEVIRILSTGLPPDPNLKKPVAGSLDTSHPFCYMREFVDDSEDESDSVEEGDSIDDNNNGKHQSSSPSPDKEMEQQIQTLNNIITQAFTSSTQIYRTLLLRATAQTLLDNWDTITTVTSGDIDRAAVSKTTITSQRSSVNSQNILKLFQAYANRSSTDWVQSWWDVFDADDDGLIDEEEMRNCIDLVIKPVHIALSDMAYMSLEVCPVRGDEKTNDWYLGGDNVSSLSSNNVNPSAASNLNNKKLSWRNRRKELKARKALIKLFQSTLEKHFRDQVELPHRLRCIYAWADKAHQDNKLDSILVDASEEWGAASSIVGRKRYVELEPKISYNEFRKEQERHFSHLDKIGEELATSFKEDLWVVQGKGRQNRELKRDCFLFLTTVSIIDLGIMML